jgi:hypothetical protein
METKPSDVDLPSTTVPADAGTELRPTRSPNPGGYNWEVAPLFDTDLFTIPAPNDQDSFFEMLLDLSAADDLLCPEKITAAANTTADDDKLLAPPDRNPRHYTWLPGKQPHHGRFAVGTEYDTLDAFEQDLKAYHGIAAPRLLAHGDRKKRRRVYCGGQVLVSFANRLAAEDRLPVDVKADEVHCAFDVNLHFKDGKWRICRSTPEHWCVVNTPYRQGQRKSTFRKRDIVNVLRSVDLRMPERDLQALVSDRLGQPVSTEQLRRAMKSLTPTSQPCSRS